VVVISAEDLESLEATIEVLGDPAVMEHVHGNSSTGHYRPRPTGTSDPCGRTTAVMNEAGTTLSR
jgi:hypothetical protein